MMKRRRILAAVCAIALAAALPVSAYADSPHFAHDEETWARLRDNVMEYEELEMLVEEYNPTYLNNQGSYIENRDGKNADEVRQKQREDAQDLYDQADSLLDTADTIKSALEDVSDSAGYLPNMPDAASVQVSKIGISTMSSSYAALQAAAVMIQQNALKTEQAAQASYEDSETRSLNHQSTQMGLKVQTQALFASYHLAQKALPTIRKNIEISEHRLAAAQRQAATGLATQTDVLKAQNTVQSLSSTLISAEANAEALRQQLCIACGWRYNDQPEIREVPGADVNAVSQMNLEADTETALAENLSLRANRRLFANMEAGSTDHENMERTIANQEETIRSSMRNLYNSAHMYVTSLQAAQAAYDTEVRNMATAENRHRLGMSSDLEYLSAQASMEAKQVDLATANINLQQAIEKYHWAMRGYMAN